MELCAGFKHYYRSDNVHAVPVPIYYIRRMRDHGYFMSRCLELAARGAGHVAPNPMVGCVVVNGGEVIGEGWHAVYGAAHAEVNALNSIKDRSILRSGTLYVSLEPCSHTGKTPPCADLIIQSGIRYVVVGCLDPNPLVAGKGIRRLIEAGIDVKLGVLEKECREQNRRFMTFHEKRRPYIILKWTQTQDGFIGLRDRRLMISSAESVRMTDQWRAEESGVWVGPATILCDNPRLTIREAKGRQPLRIGMEAGAAIPSSYNLSDREHSTLIFSDRRKGKEKNLEFIRMEGPRFGLKDMLDVLYNKEVQSVLVEGGAALHRQFLEDGLWDEVRILVSLRKLHELAGVETGVRAAEFQGNVTGESVSGTERVRIFRNISG